MDTGPAISVVIPVYCHTIEHKEYLHETLQSVAAQTLKDIEIILVDDVSPLDVAEVVNSVDGLPHTVILRNQSNMGHAQSRNIGTHAAQAELVAYLDHDDLWLPHKLEKQLSVLQSNPDVGLVFCDMETFGPHADRLNIDQSIIPERPDFYWFVSHGNYTISASSVLVRKQAMLDIGLFDPRYSTCDDFDAWLKVLMRAPILHMPETLARYRLHSSNVNYTVDRLNDNKLLTALILRYWKSAPPGEKLKLVPRIIRKLLGRMYFSFRRFRSFEAH